MKIKKFLILEIILILLWFLLIASLEMENIIVGFIFATSINLMSGQKIRDFFDLNLGLSSLLALMMFIIVFIHELIKSNFDVARRVFSPSLPINPGIVEVKTSLKSKTARMVLANAITLTPGTFTLDIREDSLFIHWIDMESAKSEEATKLIVTKFEKYLEVIYGRNHL